MAEPTVLQRLILLAFRFIVGWVFLGAALRQIPDPTWTAANLLNNASTFAFFFNFLAQPPFIYLIDALIPWIHLLLGLALFLGVFLRGAAVVGSILMILYVLPRLSFPEVFTDAHVIYSLIMIYLASIGAGRFWGLQGWVNGLGPIARNERLRYVLG
ncbi:hypothetical protein [Pelagibacterium sediminicola]|uniref:hypothetical protein n=1 Tax=Pelagibacterium sediminicola TaxID=2248761 RepID=UPI000E30EF65|nr:hypothetical protein [Pelagibacterium sediminicola]